MKKTKTKRETIGLNIPISRDLHQKLWDYIKETYPTPRFHMREIIEQALTEFLDKHQTK